MSNFNEWIIKQDLSDRLAAANCCRKAFEAGAASRQAEIDKAKSDNQFSESQIGQACVKWKEIAEKRQEEIDALNALSEMSGQKIDDLVLRNIELQKRIDGALGLLKGTSIGEVYKAIRVLRWEQADASE